MYSNKIMIDEVYTIFPTTTIISVDSNIPNAICKFNMLIFGNTF